MLKFKSWKKNVENGAGPYMFTNQVKLNLLALKTPSAVHSIIKINMNCYKGLGASK